MKFLFFVGFLSALSIAAAEPVPPTVRLTREDWAQVQEFQKWANKPLFRLFLGGSDLDGDGYVSIIEIRDYAAVELPSRATSENERALKIMHRQNPRADLDRDGVLTKRELLIYLDLFIESD